MGGFVCRTLQPQIPDIATPELMKAISAAFNSRDVERIVSFFTDDATFWLARGPEPVGAR